jgi:hypothetical protein
MLAFGAVVQQGAGYRVQGAGTNPGSGVQGAGYDGTPSSDPFHPSTLPPLYPSTNSNGSFYTYETLTDTLKEWAAKYPGFFRLYDLTSMIDSRFGFKKTWQGRTVWGVRVSSSPAFNDPDRPKIIIEGSHHGDEWMGFQTAMKLLEVLVKAYQKKELSDVSGINASMSNWSAARLSWLVDNRDIWVIPMVNPDGATYDQSVAPSGGIWRKNCRDNDGDGSFDPNVDGVDINRNYPYMWGANMKGVVGPGSGQTTQDTSVWTSSQYHGPPDNFDDDGDSAFPVAPDRWPQHNGPDWNGIDEDPVDGLDNDGDGKVDEDPDGGFSEPETCAVEALFNALDPDGDHRNGRSDVTIAVSLHAYTGCVMWPWGFTDAPSADDALMAEIGTAMAAFPEYDAYKSSNMYRTSGDTSDWFYGSMGALSFVIELGKSGQGGFHPPVDMIDNISVPNVEALLYAVEAADVADDAHEMGAPSVDIGTPGLFHTPRNSSEAGREYAVEVRVANATNLSPDGLRVRFRVDGGGWSTVRMAPSGEGRYRAAIPGQRAGASVEYYILCRDVFNNTNSLPKYGPYALFGYKVSGQPAEAFAWALLAAVPVAALAVVWRFRRERLRAFLGSLRRRPA